LTWVQEPIEFSDYLKRICHIDNVGLPARPIAIRVQGDRAPLGYEAPAHHVRLLAVAACGKPLAMARRSVRLADLIQVRKERKHLLVLACLIHERFAAAQRRTSSG
jgi:hypothetical protein